MSKEHTPSSDLQSAAQLLAGLAEAFADGTWAGIHRYATRSDLFERLSANKCPCCDTPKADPLGELMTTLIRARQGVQLSKACAYIPKPGPLPKDASERRARRQAAAGSFQAPSEIPQSHPDAAHLGATAPASEDAQ